MHALSRLAPEVRQYLLVTGNYWAFTLTDGALRMLVVLHFHALGYTPLQIAALFLFYEVFGVITNLVGGYLGARLGLNRTMNIGLAMQVVALLMLTVPATWLTIPWVMGAQALSGIAKDLNKMSAKSSIKLLVPEGQQGTLYRWVAVLTGSKNALKGVGFFLGGALLAAIGFRGALLVMAAALSLIWVSSLVLLKKDLGKAKAKPKFRELLSKSRAINVLSAARLFLFGARDVWFVVALPVYLSAVFGWDFWQVGGFLALWVIGYGIVQSLAPAITGKNRGEVPDGRSAFVWALLLAGLPAAIALGLGTEWSPQTVLLGGLLLFGTIFAINSSLHSYLIVSYAKADGVSLDVGFYYMSNALGRLVGTLLSGWVYQAYGLEACLWVSSAFVLLAALISMGLPRRHQAAPQDS
ncbi:MFS transporter [Pseudomonas sp. Choline-3u-10]|jgi:predicted MFS family arabinose efflux permease|uniref:organoarsenical effux MFS transporter ArsJ n=2 Tax=Pseudomonadales TaxID=72274 RepID=UPI000617F7EB|nr:MULTISPECIES: organoarsenical effux MFS transporter ArsJ [Pseudomonadaceae]HBM09400.1 MFS transporter [Pseudomonas sp.]KJJ65144.1 MFS transporter permease [Pseudomonas sp. 10B238]MBK3795637.1 organoarsenical effux MFS transporter ArsJ [Stutzerimonas stutzeri]MBK3878008.1 organoarsenical effux MFS transporter ArsJ [Stutzerimonas stutzeri]PKG92467.1 MFS transporter [Pseudomonas sp. Choline-3u-10]|tara:strand:- start:638 stop:1870 length:1233 start_codon:yes stop_codon:yes gene_type:complete